MTRGKMGGVRWRTGEGLQAAPLAAAASPRQARLALSPRSSPFSIVPLHPLSKLPPLPPIVVTTCTEGRLEAGRLATLWFLLQANHENRLSRTSSSYRATRLEFSHYIVAFGVLL